MKLFAETVNSYKIGQNICRLLAYQLPHKLPDDPRLKILENLETLRILEIDSKSQKISCKTFH